MDDECFVRYFLQQAVEIEPETIQAVIDNGYRTKLSLSAMDLNCDLPLIKDISLSQRSLLRKYIGAFQNNFPFTISFEHNNIIETDVSNKKRKFDEISTSFAEPNNCNQSLSTIHSPKARRIDDNLGQTVNWASDVKSPMNESLTTINQNRNSLEQSTPLSNSFKINRRKDTPYPTPSQIRYHKMLKSLSEKEKNDQSRELSPEIRTIKFFDKVNENTSATNLPKNNDVEMEDSKIINNSIIKMPEIEKTEIIECQPVKRGRKKMTKIHVCNVEPVKPNDKPKRGRATKKEPEPSTSAMTPAEQAVRAKIEAKLKADMEKKKTTRKRKA